MPPRTHLIDSIEQLKEVRLELRKEVVLAIDTEFHSEKRYYPELMLVQIANSAGDVWIFDPKKIPMTAVGEAIRNAILVTHGGQQDVGILYRDLELRPQKLFDTQIAAGFLGYRYPMGLQALCEVESDVAISKGETLTDWSARPLSEDQIRYAADDARVLLPLYEKLYARIQENGMEDRFWEACEEMVEAQIHPAPVGLSWIHWGGAASWSVEEQRVITNLLEWREEVAQRKNQSPNYLLPKSILLYLAKTQPKTLEEIQNRKVHPTFLQKYGRAALKIIEQSLKDTDEFRIPSDEQKERAHVLRLWVQIMAKETSIAATLLLPPEVLDAITLNGVSILQGWRRDLLLERLKGFLRGKECILMEKGIATLRATTTTEG